MILVVFIQCNIWTKYICMDNDGYSIYHKKLHKTVYEWTVEFYSEDKTKLKHHFAIVTQEA